MFLWLFLGFTLVPAFEIYVFIQVAGAIGTLQTIAMIIVTGVLGAYLTRREGFAVLRRLQSQVQAGHLPADELIDGAMILVGGALLLTPGFLTDVLGLALVIPPLRAVLKGILRKYLRHKFQRGGIRFFSRGRFDG
jgi:UPF0716 protein FxsA